MWYAVQKSGRTRGFNFTDDVFTVDRGRLSRILGYLNSAGLPVEWEARCRVDQLSEEFVKFLAENGCRSLHFGVESADEDVLRSIKKNISIGSFLENFEHLLRYGIRPRCSFMIGHHTDSLDSIERTLLLAAAIDQYKLGTVAIGISTPFPGTPLYENADQYGIEFVLSRWSAYSMTRPVYATAAFSADDLRRAFYLFHNDRQRVLAGRFLSERMGESDHFRERVLEWANRMQVVRGVWESRPHERPEVREPQSRLARPAFASQHDASLGFEK